MLALSLQDIRMFIVIADTQSVSEAARRLNVSQPTASYALEKLRRGFNDPLLIRSGGKMNLTETGKALASTATSSLEEFNRIARQASFDPLTSDRTFKIMGATSELTGPYAGLPGKFRKRAPGAAFSYVTYDRTNCHERLHEDVDLFVGSNLPDATSIERHVLREYPVGIYYDASVRSAPETIEDFVNAEFVTYNDQYSIVGHVDKALKEMSYPPRTFRFVVDDFSSYPDLVTGTDLLVTASLALRVQFSPDLQSRQSRNRLRSSQFHITLAGANANQICPACAGWLIFFWNATKSIRTSPAPHRNKGHSPP